MRPLSRGNLLFGVTALAAVLASAAAGALVLYRAPDARPEARRQSPPRQESTPPPASPEHPPPGSAAGRPPAVGYKVGTLIRRSDDPRDIVLQISVEPRHFVREDMAALARRLKQDFPDAVRLSAFLLDDEHTARRLSPVGHEYGIFVKALRGMYQLDRAKGEEYIEFSTARGGRQDRISIAPGPAAKAAPER